MNNYFELYDLPISFAPDKTAVKKKFYELSRQYHPDRFAQATQAEQNYALRISAMNNDAYKTLNDTDKTMAYVLTLHGVLEAEEKYSLPPAFLMEMMELNEVVSDYEMEPENEPLRIQATNTLKEYMEQWEEEVTPKLQAYNNKPDNKEPLADIKDYYFRKKYLLRIQQRINTFAAR
jgi:Fe-S protein assembly co-chaperone HscB